ncbi:DUF6415 family natural product biosynthesis protein [Streptomyces sp. NPDC002698]|uniref:DUF6415 family natural product biosynthesis protein n=1 Tax=Streptomyces sp. NPDC002698 TaxID=3364660 RepID=UPI00368BF969
MPAAPHGTGGAGLTHHDHDPSGDLMLLASHVQDRMRPFAPTTPPPRAVPACADEARRRLDAVPGHTCISEIGHARDLARSIEALCCHAVNATSSGADVSLLGNPTSVRSSP